MFVYVVQCSGTSNIKIGKTASNPKVRFSTLSTSAPYPLKLLFVFQDDTDTLENTLHRRFAAFNIHREWFKADCLGEIIALSKELDCLDITVGNKKKVDSNKTFTATTFSFNSLSEILTTPTYSKFNTYIDKIWQDLADEKGLSVIEYFNKQAREKGHVILFEAYRAQRIKARQDLEDLAAYHEMVIRNLKDPITPFDVFYNETSDKSKSSAWESTKQEYAKLADSLEGMFQLIKKYTRLTG
jgi:hypothetical protein